MDSQKVKFDLSFTPEVDKYIEIYKKQGKVPTVAGFANRIGTDEASIYAWADKKKKDENGNITDEYARPSFRAAIQRLKEASVVEEQKKEEKKSELNPKQEMFCKIYATSNQFFGNATQSYIIAYGLNADDKGDYESARRSASALMTNLDILNRIDELLRDITDELVDQELAYVIRQREELPSKMAAIREYNKVKRGISDKLDVDLKSGGQPLKQVVGFTILPPAQIDGTNNPSDQADS